MCSLYSSLLWGLGCIYQLLQLLLELLDTLCNSAHGLLCTQLPVQLLNTQDYVASNLRKQAVTQSV